MTITAAEEPRLPLTTLKQLLPQREERRAPTAMAAARKAAAMTIKKKGMVVPSMTPA